MSPTTRTRLVSDEAAERANSYSSEKRKSEDFSVRPAMPWCRSERMFSVDFFMSVIFLSGTKVTGPSAKHGLSFYGLQGNFLCRFSFCLF